MHQEEFKEKGYIQICDRDMQITMEIKRKVVLLGDTAVGKTSLVRRYVYNQFADSYIQTIGTKVSKKEINLNFAGADYSITLVIWDILGQQGYSNVQQAAFRGSDGALFICDLTRKSTLNSILNYWIPTLQLVASVPGLLLANKSDLKNWEITEEEIKEFSKVTGLPYFITSAKTGENVEDAFRALSKLMLIFKPIRGGKGEKKKIETPKDVLDFLMKDFCQNHGNWNDGMAIMEANIRVLDIDMRKPEILQLRLLIEKMYRIELYNLGEEKAQKNKVRRLGILNKIDSE